MIYVELTTDAFEEVLARQKRGKQKDARTSGAGRRIARRPTRGLEIKEDTYAILKLISAAGHEIPLIDSSSPDGQTSSGYANFMLQSVQEARMEKHQIVETFGDSYIFFFGESPRFIDVSAVIVNSHDFNWEAEWWDNYNKYLRGTKSAEMGARVYMFYDDNIVEGYIVMSQAVKTSEQPLMLQMNFRMFITNYQNISFIGDPSFPVRSSVTLPSGVNLTAGNAGATLIDKFRNAARDAIINAGADPAASSVSTLLRNGEFVGSKISELLRSASPSFGISPDTWAEIERLQVDGRPLGDNLAELAERTGRPIRGLIAENIDEFVGAPPEANMRNAGRYMPAPGETQLMLAPAVRKQWESANLFHDSIEFLSCYAADINGHKKMASLGLSVNFKAKVTSGATFTPTPNPPFGFGTTEQVGYASNQDLRPYARDSLGAVYGSAGSEFHAFGAAQNPNNRYSDGGGDPRYGYPSAFATGPGYGAAGFGDMGGFGFGGGFGANGDPGHLAPGKFTFAGVADEQSAFERFLRPKRNPTALGIHVGVHAGVGVGVGLSAGVSFGIGGKVSAFGMTAVDGTLDPSGRARQTAGYASAGRSRASLGYTNPNPFGVYCPAPGIGFGVGLSVGARASFP